MQDTTLTAPPVSSGRWRAAGIHLGLSAAIFAVLAALIAGLLFPGALFSSAGGWEGIRLIAGVDLVLGPLLTLVVFNRAKPRKEIVRDLTIVGAVQFSALTAGMFIVYQQRPVTVTWTNDRFYVATASEYDARNVDPEVRPALKPLTPVFGYIELPEDPDERRAVATTYALSGEALHLRMALYRPLDDEQSARELLRFNRLEADPEAACVNVTVATRFGDFEYCFDPARQRFGKKTPTVSNAKTPSADEGPDPESTVLANL